MRRTGRDGVRLRHVSQPERGQMMVLFVFALVALMGTVALTIDVGLVYVARRNVQNAADSAGLAGAAVLMQGAPASVAAAEALEWAEKNGYSDGVDNVTVAVNVPPTSGSHAGDPNFIEVVVEQELDAFLATVLGTDIWDVTARAVAGLEAQSSGEYALIALSEDDSSALRLNGNAYITVNGAGVMVNSNHDDAIYLNGNAQLTAGVIDVVGGWRTSGNATIDPAPQTVASISDPLATLSVPYIPDYPVQSSSVLRVQDNDTAQIQPGVYVGGIEVRGNGRLTMEAGVYILQGGGLDVSGNGEVYGTGVFVYVTCGSGSCPSGASGDVDISGNGNIALTPMTSGYWAGVTFFQDRNNNQSFRISGNGMAGTSGTIYARDAMVELNGNASTNVQIIADTIRNNGNANITIQWDGGVIVEASGMRLVE